VPRRRVHRKVLLVMPSILSVIYRTAFTVVNRTVTSLSEPLLHAFCRPLLSPRTIALDRCRPRPFAWTLTTPLYLPSLPQSVVVDPCLFDLSDFNKSLHMDPTTQDSSLTASQM
ncbi:hypothetical protein M9458_051967, partial [Cirrhinus mrigala]